MPVVKRRVGNIVLASVKAVQSKGELLFIDVGCEDQLPRLNSDCFFWSSLDSELHGGHLMLSPAFALADVVWRLPKVREE